MSTPALDFILVISLAISGLLVLFLIISIRNFNARFAKLRGKKIFITYILQKSPLPDSYLSAQLPLANEFYSVFPLEQRSQTEDAAEVIIELRWGYKEVGHYSGTGKGGYIIACQVVVRDASTKKLLLLKLFNGSAPPAKIIQYDERGRISSNPVFGNPPTKQIIGFLELQVARRIV